MQKSRPFSNAAIEKFRQLIDCIACGKQDFGKGNLPTIVNACQCQFGFRRGSSTVKAVSQYSDKILSSMDRTDMDMDMDKFFCPP